MKKISDRINSFEELIKGGFLYVDKTEAIWELVRVMGGYSLARPHRFGMSLFLSTLKAIFEGKKELFEGLAIYDKPYDWKPYPVLHIDLGDYSVKEDPIAEFPEYWRSKVYAAAEALSIDLAGEGSAYCLGELIVKLAKRGKVVVLIEEFDKPLMVNLGHPQIAELQRMSHDSLLALKACDAHERFVLLTGVNKFCPVSAFSGLNNLFDISMHSDYATTFGYTQTELEKYFADRIDLACEQLKLPREKFLKKLRDWYGNYRFDAKVDAVYNPSSIAQFFSRNCEFGNYWSAPITPSVLRELMEKMRFDLAETLKRHVSHWAFHSMEFDKIDPLSLLLATGYLTIKRSKFVDFGETWYKVGFPNREVKHAYETLLGDSSAAR